MNKDGIPNMSCDAGGTCICPKGYIPDMTEGACKKDIGREKRYSLKHFFHNLHYFYKITLFSKSSLFSDE